jgi:hypothetical protein
VWHAPASPAQAPAERMLECNNNNNRAFHHEADTFPDNQQSADTVLAHHILAKHTEIQTPPLTRHAGAAGQCCSGVLPATTAH